MTDESDSDEFSWEGVFFGGIALLIVVGALMSLGKTKGKTNFGVMPTRKGMRPFIIHEKEKSKEQLIREADAQLEAMEEATRRRYGDY